MTICSSKTRKTEKKISYGPGERKPIQIKLNLQWRESQSSQIALEKMMRRGRSSCDDFGEDLKKKRKDDKKRKKEMRGNLEEERENVQKRG